MFRYVNIVSKYHERWIMLTGVEAQDAFHRGTRPDYNLNLEIFLASLAGLLESEYGTKKLSREDVVSRLQIENRGFEIWLLEWARHKSVSMVQQPASNYSAESLVHI